MIDKFEGRYSFCQTSILIIEHQGIKYPSVEHFLCCDEV
jgi:hypothetical protein